MSASLPGFQTETVTGLRVTFNSNVRQDLRLAVGCVMRWLNVMAARPDERHDGRRARVRASVPLTPPIRIEQNAAMPLDHRRRTSAFGQ